MQNTDSKPKQTGMFAVVIAVTLGIMVALTLMAGLPPAENMGGFTVGVITLIAVTTAIGLFGWIMLIKPLADGVTISAPIAVGVTTRSVIALLLSLSALATGIATVWDEIWHTRYGIPFGEDFLWRPHLLLYFSFSTMIILAGWSWWTLMTRAKGTLQQRFRANPLLGFSFISGVFTLLAIGSDPLWHTFYGEDLSPWSLPHLFIVLLVLVMGLLATAFHKTLMAEQTWRIGFKHFAWRNLLILLVLVGGMITFLLLFTVQWYTASQADPAAMAAAAAGGDVATIRAAAAVSDDGALGLLLQIAVYPDWMFSVFLTFIAMLFGTLALHNTRQVGSATLVGLVSLGVRLMMESNFNSESLGARPLYILIPMLLTLDIIYAISLSRTQKTPPFWVSGVIMAVVYILISTPLIPALFPFMSSSPSVLPMRFIVSLIAALGSIWLAQMIGSLSGEASSDAQAPITSRTQRVTALVYSAFGAFLVFFIVTATPPV